MNWIISPIEKVITLELEPETLFSLGTRATVENVEAIG